MCIRSHTCIYYTLSLEKDKDKSWLLNTGWKRAIFDGVTVEAGQTGKLGP